VSRSHREMPEGTTGRGSVTNGYQENIGRKEQNGDSGTVSSSITTATFEERKEEKKMRCGPIQAYRRDLYRSLEPFLAATAALYSSRIRQP